MRCYRFGWLRKRGFRSQVGQVFVFTALSMVGLCGVAGFAIDTSTWYRAHRAEQAIADASALAAADDLPTSTSPRPMQKPTR